MKKSLSHKPQDADDRMMTAAVLRGRGLRQADIAAVVGVSQAAVSKMLRRHEDYLAFSPDYRARWREVEQHETELRQGLEEELLTPKQQSL